ncbi:hypothetical protein Gorai_010266, partial [Gossypium raimondii]|nr:hypothetical protein [Gossypium raimondii]
AYWSLKEESWNPRDPFWKRSWKYQGLQRVKFFLWLASKQKLLTNVECVRRGIGQNSTCSVCGKEPEDTLYVLRDCSAAKEIWKHIIPDNQLFRVVANDNGHVSAGGVIRYHHENWILGFTRYLGWC